MIIAIIYYIICKIIGITTWLLFKTDTTKKLREEFKKDFVKYFTEE